MSIIKTPRTALRRRAFLRSAAGGVLALPFLHSLWPSESRAAPSEPKAGLFTIVQPLGTARSKWWPKTGAGVLDGSSFAGDHAFSSMAGWESRMLFVRGLDNVPRVSGCGHHRAAAALLSAQLHRENGGGNRAGADSIDTLISKHWDSASRPPLILLGGQPTSSKFSTSTHENGNPLYGVRNPAQALSAIANVLPSDPGGGVDELALARARGRSVLDFVHGELCDLRTHRLSSGDRIKLEAYTEAIRGVEQDLSGGSSHAGCQAPTEDYGALGGEPNAPLVVAEYAQKMIDVAVLAAACGFRQAITFYMGGEANKTDYSFLGAPCTHHGLSHHSCQNNDVSDFNPNRDGYMHDIDTWMVESLFKRAVEGLASFDGQNGDLLEEYSVLMINAFSDARIHLSKDIPIVMAGSMNGYFRQGRTIEVTGSQVTNGSVCKYDTCRPHNRFLNMLAHATGIESNHFGHNDLPGGDYGSLLA